MAANQNVLVIGAGIGGLAAAMRLAAAGHPVTVLERANVPGGKMREVQVGEAAIDAGPTVLTLRHVFDELFEAAGASLEAEVRLHTLPILARHAWSAGQRLDLHADPAQAADAIGDFAGAAEATGYLAFCARARAIFATLESTFLRQQRAGPVALARRVGLRRLPQLLQIAPFRSLWQALGEYFRDPRLRQLFGRYATYCGASPFAAPATLMLVAHVEQAGVHAVEGGMQRLADAMHRVALRAGVEFRFGDEVQTIDVRSGRASGVTLATGETLPASAVVFNADVAALAAGHFGAPAMAAAPGVPLSSRSLSALTWCAQVRTQGFPLERHNVFFSADYAAEFAALIGARRMAAAPTVYVCAQDRGVGARVDSAAPERLLCLVNAPPTGDGKPMSASDTAHQLALMREMLARAGLHLETPTAAPVVSTPNDFDRRFPATGGALYGRASHGWRASFARAGARTRLPGLYLAGGSVHPGPGIPMAALSGALAASCVQADLTSRPR